MQVGSNLLTSTSPTQQERKAAGWQLALFIAYFRDLHTAFFKPLEGFPRCLTVIIDCPHWALNRSSCLVEERRWDNPASHHQHAQCPFTSQFLESNPILLPTWIVMKINLEKSEICFSELLGGAGIQTHWTTHHS